MAVIGARECETLRKAVAFVPGGTWAEKDGTLVNGDRRLQRVRALERGTVRQVRVCTRCLRAGKVQKAV